MNTEQLERAFQKMGARVEVNTEWGRFQRQPNPLSLNIRRDKKGEYFTIWNTSGADLEVLNVEPKDRHLLLLERNGKDKHRYLLGHDERHWFVAAIPESTPVSTVKAAKEALKPKEVLHKQVGLKAADRQRRRNEAWVRQGEWFFVPCPGLEFENSFRNPILKNEPIVRSRGGKPHFCSELYRSGGETVYVSGERVLTEKQYDALDEKERRSRSWTVMRQNMDVWVRGTVRHPDHKTIELAYWHKVLSNTESLSFAMRNVQFLD